MCVCVCVCARFLIAANRVNLPAVCQPVEKVAEYPSNGMSEMMFPAEEIEIAFLSLEILPQADLNAVYGYISEKKLCKKHFYIFR